MFKICTILTRNLGIFPLHTIQAGRSMKYLNVAEKNDAAKTIAALLSNGSARRREGHSVYNKIYDFEYVVKGVKSKMVMTSVSGHLQQYEFTNAYKSWRSCDPLLLFDATLVKQCNNDYLPIKKTLEREIRSCQGLILWTDCDREGENIAFEIINVCTAIKPNIIVYRAKFSEITSAGVRRAIANLVQPDKCQSDAVDIRSELDLRTGAAITRLQTLRLQSVFPEKIADKLISYGSCQIPTLGFVVERYKEVEAFISEPFWKIKVTHTIDDLTVDFNWARNRLFDKDACEDYLLLCLADPNAEVKNVTTKPKNKWRPTAMDTVELEKLGSRKLKLSAKETMTIAEKLYTKGIISYPRTETNAFSKEIDLKSLVAQQVSHTQWGEFAQRVLECGPSPKNGNKSDEAHPPIHPTKLVTSLTGNDARVYELITRHFLACVFKDARGSETIVNIDISGEKFTATGLCIHERNYLDVYIYEKWNARQIHKYEVGQTFQPTDISIQEGATTPPPLLTEADLIGLMEKHGIGTDATHAEHINTIKERGYIGEVDAGFLVPGVIGMGLYEGYEAMELVLAKPALRAEFEADLKKICLGLKDPKTVLQEQLLKYKEAYRVIKNKMEKMDEKIAIRINDTPKATLAVDDAENWIQEVFECPKCRSSKMSLKKKKDSTAFYIGCLNYPNCKNAIWLAEELKNISLTEQYCGQCKVPSKLLKMKLNSIYRVIFESPDGWYTTCLRCDTKFRETFNINADQVKHLGAIVADDDQQNFRKISLQPGINAKAKQNCSSIRQILPTSSTKKIMNSIQPRQAKKKAVETNLQNHIREFVTYGSETIVQNVDTRAFFETNDGFDDLILNASNVKNDTEQTSNTNVANNGYADILMNDDFDDFNWDVATSTLSSVPNGKWDCSAQRFPMPNCSKTIKCTECNHIAKELIVKKEGPNKGRKFYTCSKSNTCNFFQWADIENQNADNTSRGANQPSTNNLSSEDFIIKCNCKIPARSSAVRKDGPNHGRTFYSCNDRNKSCGFFKWAEDVVTDDRNGSFSDGWGTSRLENIPEGSRVNIYSNRPLNIPSKRKCGLCRKEGHSRTKCPRKIV